MRYGTETRDEVRRSVAGLSRHELTQKVYEWALTLKLHPSTVYRWVGAAGLLRRSRRADKGARRAGVSAEAYDRMLAMTVRYDMAAEDVIEHAEAYEWIAPGAVSVAAYNRWLAQDRLSRRNLTPPGRMDGKLIKTRLKIVPHRRFEAAHSNELHQMDLTELPRYFVQADGSIGFESPLTLGANKKGNSRPRLQLFVLVDDHSRGSYARLYYGKNALNWTDFCMKAWDAKPDAATFPFCGRPSTLFSDNDSAPKSGMFKQFLTDMDVEFLAHEVGNSMAKGKVERLIQTLKRKMISILRVYIDQGREVTLALGNEILHDLLYKINYRKHASTGEQPMLRWQSGLAGPARMMPSPEVRERYFYDSTQCLLRGDLTVQFGGSLWQLPRKEPFISVVGEKVQVYFHRGQAQLERLIVMVDDREYPVEARTVVPDVAGEFKSLPRGRTEQMLHSAFDQDLSEVQAGGIYRGKYAQHMFPAQQEAFDEMKISGPKRVLPKLDLKMRLRDDGVMYRPEDIDALYEQGEVFETDYETIAARFRAVG